MSQLLRPVLHTQDRSSAVGWHSGTRVTLPPEAKGFHVLVTSRVSRATEGQADQATTVHMHTGLFPIVQGKEIHIHQSCPTPTPSGHPEASPPFLGKLSGTRHG